MAKTHTVTLGADTFALRSGQILLDGAIANGVEIPHDCRAGRCGSCMTDVKAGITLGGETRQRGTIYACQARVFSDLNISIDPVPPVVSVRATVTQIVDLTPDVVEVTLKPAVPFAFFPGQYCRFTFTGFPTRCFSPTASLDGSTTPDQFKLQIKRVRDGRVSTKLGTSIAAGHSVIIEGPFGHAYLRPKLDNRLVLVAGGTGFAPIWSVADAALTENPDRHVVMVVGVRKLGSFYMGTALDLANRLPNVEIIATAEEAQNEYHSVLHGVPADHVPQLDANDIVYAAGSPVMVDVVGDLAQSVDAVFYSDPFESADAANEDWLTRAMSWLRTG